MKTYLLAAAAVLATAIPSMASASVTLTSVVPYALNVVPGVFDKVITFDRGGAAYTLTGSGSVVDGSTVNNAAPGTFFSTDNTNYLAGEPGSPAATLSGFGSYTIGSLYWGSMDSYNFLDVFSGNTLLGTISGDDAVLFGSANGDQTSPLTNARVTFKSDTAFDRLSFRTGSPAFEVDNVAFAGEVTGSVAAPERLAALESGVATLAPVGARPEDRAVPSAA